MTGVKSDAAQGRVALMCAEKDLLDGGCLLCSEDRPHHSHRRLVGEYLSDHWGGLKSGT